MEVAAERVFRQSVAVAARELIGVVARENARVEYVQPLGIIADKSGTDVISEGDAESVLNREVSLEDRVVYDVAGLLFDREAAVCPDQDVEIPT